MLAAGTDVTTDLTPFSPFAETLIEFIKTSSIFETWPACRQALLELVAGDEAWQLAFPVLACLVVGGGEAAALPVAGAWTALRHAANLLDAVQDGDELPAVVGGQPAKALSCAAGLIFSAFQLANATSTYPGARQKVVASFAAAGFDSARGQYMGFDLQKRPNPGADDLEGYWNALILKSGSIYRAGAAGGAAAGTDNEPWIAALGQYGIAIGVMRQLLDDCRDVIRDPQAKEYEVALPLLLHALTVQTKAIKLVHMGSARADLLSDLNAGRIPEVIADVLLEWQRRALLSLKPLERTESLAALELIPQLVLAPENITA